MNHALALGDVTGDVVDLLDKLAEHLFSNPLRRGFSSVSPRDQGENAVLCFQCGQITPAFPPNPGIRPDEQRELGRVGSILKR